MSEQSFIAQLCVKWLSGIFIWNYLNIKKYKNKSEQEVIMNKGIQNPAPSMTQYSLETA